jgi:hypothetical protein
MNIQEIIEREERVFNAKKEIEATIKKSKSEILLPFAMDIFNFLEVINNDPKFLFTCEAHPREEDYSPLFKKDFLNFEFHKNKAIEEIKKSAFHRHLTRSFSYGNYGSRYLTFGIGEDLNPFVRFSKDMSPKSEEIFFSTEEAIIALTRFFLQKRKK